VTISRDAVLDWIKAYAAAIATDKDALTQLDAQIGDGDHGANMHRGFQAVLAKLPGVADKDIGSIFKTVGMTLVSTVGGAGGPLYGTFFMQLGTATSGKMEMTLADWSAALQAGVDGVVMRGKANPGDKTMVDAWLPALEAYQASPNTDLAKALLVASDRARGAAEATIPLLARKGRASYLGERSVGHQDPGATSSWLLLKALASVCNSSSS